LTNGSFAGNNYEDILLTQRCGPHITVASNEEHQAYVDAYVLHIVSTLRNCMQLSNSAFINSA
jgi:hypothetical protein